MPVDASKLAAIDLKALVEREASIRLSNRPIGKNREYHGSCPFCNTGDDRFWVAELSDSGKPMYFCRQCSASGDALSFLTDYSKKTFIEALDQLGLKDDDYELKTEHRKPERELEPERDWQSVETVTTSPTTLTVSAKEPFHVEPTSIEEYAQAHGMTVETLNRAGWTYTEVVWNKDKGDWVPCSGGKPAVSFKTASGMRYRFLDFEKGKPKYGHKSGYKRSWYGFEDRVITQAKEANFPLVLCNGEISAVVARYYGIPAITIAGGGETAIPDDLLEELNARWHGRIAIAMDCDDKGRSAAQAIHDQLPKSAIVDLGLLDKQDLADFCVLHRQDSPSQFLKLIPEPKRFATNSRVAAKNAIARLDVRNTLPNKPIIIPFKSFHQYGGYAKIGMPGKLSGFVGMSGHGKTSFLNTTIDALLRRGENGVGIMPEFDADEYHWDRLQRYTGYQTEHGVTPHITAEMMMDWELWKKEAELGIPAERRQGVALTADEQIAVETTSRQISNWSGSFDLFPMNGKLEDSLFEMGIAIQERRARGEMVTFCAFDYVQILDMRGDEDTDNSYEAILGLIKRFCMHHQIHGMVTSQVNKTADRSSRGENRPLTSTDMRYIRDDKFNLLVTLNLHYSATGEPGLDGNPTMAMTKIAKSPYYAGMVNIAKNNKGRKGTLRMMVDFTHLLWIDKHWEDHQTEKPLMSLETSL